MKRIHTRSVPIAARTCRALASVCLMEAELYISENKKKYEADIEKK